MSLMVYSMEVVWVHLERALGGQEHQHLMMLSKQSMIKIWMKVEYSARAMELQCSEVNF